jgi:internalin A
MMKLWQTAMLVLLSMVGVGQAGEKEIIERLKMAGIVVERHKFRETKEAIFVRLLPQHNAKVFLPDLAYLDRLRGLVLIKTNVTDQDMLEVGCFPGLVQLALADTSISDKGLNAIKGLRNLRGLMLNNTKVTDAGLKVLIGFPDLETLTLDDTGVTDEGIKSIIELHRLRTLDLRNTKLTDAGLQRLTSVSSLSELELVGTNVTDEGVARFKKALPNCRVIW